MTYVQPRLPCQPQGTENWQQNLAAAVFLVGSARMGLPTLDLFSLD